MEVLDQASSDDVKDRKSYPGYVFVRFALTRGLEVVVGVFRARSLPCYVFLSLAGHRRGCDSQRGPLNGRRAVLKCTSYRGPRHRSMAPLFCRLSFARIRMDSSTPYR